MIPKDKDDNNSKNFNTPKRFYIGYYTCETFDLFGCGWRAASRNLKEFYRQEEARETRKHIVELLEEGLYDSASRGTQEQKIQALQYFQSKKQFEQQKELQPYSWGEQLLTVANALAIIAITAGVSVSIAIWACGSNQSRFCSNIKGNTAPVIEYFIEPKN
jgi:hypothetical protein